MNRRPPPTSATQPPLSWNALAPSSSNSGPSSASSTLAETASERQEARRWAWLWLFFRNSDIGAQLTEGVQSPEHLLPTVDGLAADIHHPVDGGLRDIGDGFDHVVVDRVDRIRAPIVRPAGDLRAVLAAQVAGAEGDAGAGEAADARRGDADRGAAR